jgi:hypothetical protein
MGDRKLAPGPAALQGRPAGGAEVVSDAAPERWCFENFTLDLASRTLRDACGSEVPPPIGY